MAQRGVLASIIGGWQLSGIYTLQSGALTITGNGTVLNTPATPRSPTWNGEHNVLGGLDRESGTRSDGSLLPAAGQQGNLARNNGPRPRVLEPRCVALQALCYQRPLR